MRMDVEYLGESGFLVSCGEEALLFDPGEGEEELRMLPGTEERAAFRRLTVLVTRAGAAWLSPELRGRCPEGTAFVLDDNFPDEEEGLRLTAGETLEVNGVRVTACPSTDEGVAFLCEWQGARIFHAGGLNLWHWRDISTIPEIEAAERAFNDCLAAIPKEPVDLAFFPLDPRQGSMFEAGANYFIFSIKPRILIPMHYFHRGDVALEYARTASCRTTEVIALPECGDRLTVEADAEGYLNLSFPEKQPAAEPQPEAEKPLDMLSEDDPFLESDLPLPQLMESEPPAAPPEPESPRP